MIQAQLIIALRQGIKSITVSCYENDGYSLAGIFGKIPEPYMMCTRQCYREGGDFLTLPESYSAPAALFEVGCSSFTPSLKLRILLVLLRCA